MKHLVIQLKKHPIQIASVIIPAIYFGSFFIRILIKLIF